MSRWRFLPSGLLVLVVAAVGLAAGYAESTTWRSIWIGAAFTALAAALVDFAGVLAAYRRERSIHALAARKLKQARQDLGTLVRVVFDPPSGDDLAAQLSEMPAPTEIDLSAPAAVYPPRTKQEWIQQLRQKLADDLDVLTAFAATGACVQATTTLDAIVNSSPFGALTDIFALQTTMSMDDEGSTLRSLAKDISQLDNLVAKGR